LGTFVGRLVSGVLWGIAASMAWSLAQGGPRGLRQTAKNLMRVYMRVADQTAAVAAEARETLADLHAEVQAERAAALDDPYPDGQVAPSGPGGSNVRS